ncbi:hypothetical protein [Streptomyces rochei]|uniref:hypothetical protein n=1 Tax=Streptomyces rochei TaxID=1928 RepID=UPI003530DE4B
MALIAERARGGSASPMEPAPGGGTAGIAAAVNQADDAPSAVPVGFSTRETWQEALRAAALIAKAVRGAGQPCGALGDGRSTLTADELARAVVQAVRYLDSVEAVKLLAEAHNSGLQVLSDSQALRARFLLDNLKGLETLDRGPEASASETAADRTWRLYTCYERLKNLSVETSAQRELTEYLPLPVVDDLVDAACLTARAVPEEGARRLYLQARLTPSRVSVDGLQELGWHSEVLRREFYTRLADGDASVLDQTFGLSSGQWELVSELRAVRGSGRVTPGLSKKKWLWPVLERLAPQTPVDLRRDKSFGPWLLVRRIQRALRLAHQSRVRGEEQKHLTLLRAAWNDAHALQRSWTLAGWEARNVMAYLLVLQSDDGPRYEEALDILSSASGSGMREDRMPWEARRRLEGNREVLHQLARQRESNHILNPYLVLGVPDGADNWKERWRTLRRSLDMDGEALANEAKDAIEAFERGRAAVSPYAVPLMPGKWAHPHADVPEAVRSAMPMPRQTAPATETERQFAKYQAAAAVVGTACHTVGLPPVGESSEDLLRKSSSE